MFIPIPRKYLESGMNLKKLVIDHIDNIKYHNIVPNLQWLTSYENTLKWYDSIEGMKDLIVSDKTVKKICKKIEDGMTIYEISQKYDVSESLVYKIKYKLSYTEISKNYTFPSKQLSEEDVIKICEELAKGKSSYKISKEMGYSQAVVNYILSRDSWTQISKDYEFPNSRINDDAVYKICEYLQEGKHPKEISKIMNISQRVIDHIRCGKTHTDISKNFTFEYDKFKVADKTVHAICKDLSEKKKFMKDIAKDNNVSLTFVKDIKYRRSRKDISDQYDW